MNKNIKTIYCYDEDKNTIHYTKTKKGQAYYCIDCGSELLVREGQIYAKHLAHKNAEHCGGTGETTIEEDLSIVEQTDEKYLKAIEECDSELLEGLNDNQKLAVTHMDGACCVSASAGSGKALVNSTLLQTPNGQIEIGKAKIGDTILGRDGKITSITGVYPQGKKQVYEVEFSDGHIVECCNEHLWTVQTASMRTSRNTFKTLSLQEIIDTIPLAKITKSGTRNNCYIPMTEPVEFSKKALLLNPYLLGVLLGDGYLCKTSQSFSNSEKDIINKVNNLLNEIGYELKQSQEFDYRIKITTALVKRHKKSFLSQSLHELGLLGAKSSNKFIPKDYLYAPIESRIDVLKGLIDTDGYMSGSCLYEYSTSSRQLAKDVQFICESLGFTVKISEKLPTYKYGSETLEGQKSYRLFIKTSKKIPKIHSSEKHEKAYKKPQSYARRYIKDIRKTNRYEEMTCISVDNEDELFLINNFIVTHNTRVLTKRIEYLISQGVSPSSILTFTFTKKASEEMKSRLNKSLGEKSNQITIGTFHSVYYSILRDYNSRGMGRKKVDIAPDWWKEKTINEILSNFNTNGNFELDAKVILSMIAKQKNNVKSPSDDLVIADEIKFLESTYKEIYRQYEAKKDKENKIDFEDMVFKCYQIFKKDNEFLQYYRNKFKYILVDEFQDSNNLQEAVLELITNDQQNIFVVGDARQSIYKFMEANVNIMFDFQEKWNSRLIELDTNYRSSEDIVKYSNNLISHNKRALGGDAKANKPKHKEPIFFKSNSEYSESEEIVKEIQLILNEGKYKPDDITLLFRTNAQSQPLEESLMKADLPYVIIGGLGFYDRREIKDMLSYLQLSKNPHNDLAMLEVFNRPNRFLGKVFLQEITDYANRNNCSIYQSMKQSPLCSEWRYKKGTSELVLIIDKLSALYNSNKSVEYILNEAMMLTNYRVFLQKENEVEKYTDKIENIETLIRFTQDFSSASLFLEHIDNMKKAPTEEDTEGKIKLLSTHKSKGLEFPVVFVTGVSYGQFPFYREKFKSSFDLEEERRLMYVAMTRAEDILYISSIDSYRNTPLEESPFIKEMKEHKNKK